MHIIIIYLNISTQGNRTKNDVYECAEKKHIDYGIMKIQEI